MSGDNLPRVTYSNVGVDFTPVHDKLDGLIPDFKKGLGRAWPNLIGGRADRDGAAYKAASPIDGRLILGEFIEAAPAAVDRAVRAARAAYPAWSALPWPGRVAVLRRAAEILARRKYELGIACLIEVGKSRMEAMGEAEESHDLIAYYCDEMERNQGFTRDMARAFPQEAASVTLRPVGVFAVIAPFNFPLALSVSMIAGALLGGNTVVYKPSPKAGLTGSLLVEALTEAGVPPGVVNLVCGEEAGRLLVDHPGLDGAAFTGSHAVGMEIFRKMAAGPYARPVVVEMGGKNPAYVTAKADLDVAAEGVMRSAFGLQGQKCSACSVAYVEAAVYEPFLRLLAEKTSKLKLGNPERRDVYMGPVIDAEAGGRFESAVAAARRDGNLIAGGARRRGDIFEHGHYVEPTVVGGLPADHALLRDELFLPFVAIAKCDDLGDGLRRGNAVPYGLTAGVYTSDRAELDYFFAQAEAGVLYANRRSGATTGAWPGIQTFCGWKGSGATSKGGLGPFYLPQFMREQSRTIMGS
ncbi:MAG: aldehyde dehydrogenase family protein [Alphaproteobacteria bacterium]|nr:aldehyde dehydrogenase family protein [Alphaproteobacteria bacterium]